MKNINYSSRGTGNMYLECILKHSLSNVTLALITSKQKFLWRNGIYVKSSERKKFRSSQSITPIMSLKFKVTNDEKPG